MGKSRYNNYDLLRVIACVFVIIIHVSYGFLTTNSLKSNLFDLTSVIAWNTFSRIAVPIFIMLSGAFLLSNSKNENYKTFYLKSFKKIGVPTIVFSLLFFVYYMLLNVLQIKIGIKEVDSLVEPVVALISGTPYYHFWYLYTIIWLYVLTPVIIRIKNSINHVCYRNVAIIFLIVGCICDLTSTHYFAFDLGFSIHYLGYFLIGDVIKTKYEDNKSRKKFYLYLFLSIIVLVILCPIYKIFYIKGMNSFTANFIQGNFNPLIVFSAIMFFSAFSNLTVKRQFSKLSEITLYIYLFHVIPCDIIFKICRYLGIVDNINPNIVIVIGTIFCFIVSLMLSKIWLKIWSHVKEKLERKIDEFVSSKGKECV